MVDDMLDPRLADELRAYAEGGVRPIDPVAITLAASGRRRLLDRLAARPGLRLSGEARLLLIAAALLAALVVGTALIGGSRVRPPVHVDAATVTPTPSAAISAEPVASASPPAPASPGAVAASLVGTWLADAPASLSLGDAEPAGRLRLVIDTNGAQGYLTTSAAPFERLSSFLSDTSEGGIAFEARTGGDSVWVDGELVRPCGEGDLGTYGVQRSDDGLLLTLTPVDEPCASRAAVLARTWVRSHGGASSGGPGVVDALDQLFIVDLPGGSYRANVGTPGAVTIEQAIPEFQFLAFTDPQGFLDPCDPEAGRFEVAPGADALVDYFRQLDGFTVDSVSELTVDGHRAVRLVLHANRDARCPSGPGLVQWQPKVVTDPGVYWFLRPGDTDSLVIVELADATLMFEVLAAPHPDEAAVIGSIRFLEDGLPASP
jgi:hypothetical protein